MMSLLRGPEEGPGPPHPSPPEVKTDSNLRPPKFWKPRSLGAVSVVAVVCPDRGRNLPKNPGANPANAIGTLLDLSVIGADRAVLGGISSGSPIIKGLFCDFRLQRSRNRRSSRMTAIPATPPTTPPTSVGVGGVLLPDPLPAPAVEVEVAPGSLGLPPLAPLPVGAPEPLAMKPVVEDPEDDNEEDAVANPEDVAIDDPSVVMEVPVFRPDREEEVK